MSAKPSDPSLPPSAGASDLAKDGVPPADDASPDSAPAGSRRRIGHTLSVGWHLAVVAYRDPEHVAERIALHSTQSLGEPSLEWAQRVREEREGVPRAVIAEQLRTDSAKIAAIDGAVAGTPFLIALVPGYLVYLRQEARMLLRIAALYDRDPRSLETAAEMLALRGVDPTVDAARSALLAVRDMPVPEKPTARRPWRTWVRAVYVLLIYGGFLSAPSDKSKEASHPWIKTGLGFLTFAIFWVVTCVFPLTFIIAMAWGCDSSARDLGRRALIFYDSEPDSAQAAIAAAKLRKDPGHNKRQILRTILLVFSVALPIAFIAFIDRERQSTGITPLTGVGSLVALSLVIATAVIATRR